MKYSPLLRDAYVILPNGAYLFEFLFINVINYACNDACGFPRSQFAPKNTKFTVIYLTDGQ